jgi:hypothetical protein
VIEKCRFEIAVLFGKLNLFLIYLGFKLIGKKGIQLEKFLSAQLLKYSNIL